MTRSLGGAVLSKLPVSLRGPVTWDEIEPRKFLLADSEGFLRLVLVAGGQLRQSELGRVSPGAQVRYIDNRVVYAGVFAGPSALLRITQNSLEPIAAFPNPGPLLDMVAVPGSVPGETHLLAAGGFDAVGLRGGFHSRPPHSSRSAAASSASRSLWRLGEMGKLGKLGKSGNPKRKTWMWSLQTEKPWKLEKLGKPWKPGSFRF